MRGEYGMFPLITPFSIKAYADGLWWYGFEVQKENSIIDKDVFIVKSKQEPLMHRKV